MKREDWNVSRWKKELDRVFSIYIRKRDKNICFTCKRYFERLQAGHFISRQHNSVRYSEMNTNAQCVACNVWKRGNIGEYAHQLIEKYGQKKFKELVAEGRKIKQWDKKELEKLVELYKQKTKDLDD